jgi:hypothetical protein
MQTTQEKAQIFATAVAATKESRAIDFKSTFDPTQTSDWCELLKDVFAFANSAGGVIVVGVDGRGAPMPSDVTALLSIDPADIGNKIRSYTGVDFDDIEISEHVKNGIPIAVIQIGSADTPIVPTRPGTYSKNPPKQATAFSVGQVYVRHGAKSEPATTNDLARIIDRRVREMRRTWMSGIKKVTTAPIGAVIEVSNAKETQPKPDAVPYRLVVDEGASAIGAPDFDKTHPHRTMECLKLITGKISETGRKVNVGDLKAIIAVHSKGSELSFTWKSAHGPRQYSQACIDWIVEHVKKDKLFATKAKSKLRRSQT